MPIFAAKSCRPIRLHLVHEPNGLVLTRRFKIQTLAVVLLSIPLLVLTDSPVQAELAGLCPSGAGWQLVAANDIVTHDIGNTFDQNGDGFVCFRDNVKGFREGQAERAWLVKDNTNPLDE